VIAGFAAELIVAPLLAAAGRAKRLVWGTRLTSALRLWPKNGKRCTGPVCDAILRFAQDDRA